MSKLNEINHNNDQNVEIRLNKVKKVRKNRSKLGDNYVAPDGGYAWFVCLAAGCSNLCSFPVLQQFGLLFRDQLENKLKINNSQITTIINLNSALTSCVGLANGPLFRRFTYRQVGIFGALLVAISLFLTSIANSFIFFLITFSILYGCGVGINASANSLALNTYFKERRRIATGLSWTVTALGPIVVPHIITLLMQVYDVQGIVMLFSGFALNAVACALLYQPAQWHSKNKPIDGEVEPLTTNSMKEPEIECKYCQSLKKKPTSIFSSQYLYNADDSEATGYEIIDPGTPMMALTNDGWFSRSRQRSAYGSKLSLTSNRTSKNDYDSKKTSNTNLVMSNRPSYVNLGILAQDGGSRRDKRRDTIINKPKIEESAAEDCPTLKAPQDLSETEKSVIPLTLDVRSPSIYETQYLKDNQSIRSGKIFDPVGRKRSNTFSLEKEVLKSVSKKLEQYITRDSSKIILSCTCEEEKRAALHAKEQGIEFDNAEDADDDRNYTLLEKIIIFFDLDLLKDYTYLNLMVGITIANFAELNFSILTPFVLGDFGLTKAQIALAMSLLGAFDITVRFFIPFVAGKIGWQNHTFFLFGVLLMAFGRVVLAHFHSYAVTIALFCWIGIGKGLRTVFMALVIPSYIPLDRLPAATGLHLLFAGIFYLLMGPIVGWIRDATNYTVTLHCLNVATYLTAISWGLEKLYTMRKEKFLQRNQQECDDN